jgi:hypothetical protein
MHKIIIDLPKLGQQVTMPSSQWKYIRKWLIEREIQYEEKEPDKAPARTDADTVLVFEIQSHHEEVRDYLREHS